MKELKRCIVAISIIFFVSMKGLELSCTLPTWLSVHQTDDKITSITAQGTRRLWIAVAGCRHIRIQKQR